MKRPEYTSPTLPRGLTAGSWGAAAPLTEDRLAFGWLRPSDDLPSLTGYVGSLVPCVALRHHHLRYNCSMSITHHESGSIKTWSLFPLPLNLTRPCNLLQSTEPSRSDVVQAQNLAYKTPCMLPLSCNPIQRACQQLCANPLEDERIWSRAGSA